MAELLPPERLTLREHLEELRRRLLLVVATAAVAAIVAFAYAERLIHWLKAPAGDQLPRLAFFSPTEALTATMKVAVFCGAVAALPVALTQLWAFVRPALTPKQHRYGVAFVWWGSILFVAGAAVAYYVMLPLFLNFLLGFGRSYGEPIISLNQYLSFVTGIMLACGAVFELPLVVFLLTRVGLVTSQALQRQRGLALIVLLIVAAILTPTTDAVSLLIFTGPLWLLYEASIFVARLSNRQSR